MRINEISEIIENNNSVLLFHGTHKDLVTSFKEEGLRVNNEYASDRGKVFLSPRADVAFAYANMSGESAFLGKSKPKLISDEERALIVFEIPKDWYEQNKVREVEGTLPEVSFNVSIPPEFIKDVIVGNRQEVYSKYD